MKTIAIRDEVYELLSRMKKDKESFSDVILRILEERRRMSIDVFGKYAGILRESDILDVVMRERGSFKVREFDF